MSSLTNEVDLATELWRSRTHGRGGGSWKDGHCNSNCAAAAGHFPRHLLPSNIRSARVDKKEVRARIAELGHNFLICRSRSPSCTGRRQRTCTQRLSRSICRPRKHLKQRPILISWPMMPPATMTGSALVLIGITFVSVLFIDTCRVAGVDRLFDVFAWGVS